METYRVKAAKTAQVPDDLQRMITIMVTNNAYEAIKKAKDSVEEHPDWKVYIEWSAEVKMYVNYWDIMEGLINSQNIPESIEHGLIVPNRYLDYEKIYWDKIGMEYHDGAGNRRYASSW